jgi:hypothetical protein
VTLRTDLTNDIDQDNVHPEQHNEANQAIFDLQALLPSLGQTPWLSDIDAAAYALIDVASVGFHGSFDLGPFDGSYYATDVIGIDDPTISDGRVEFAMKKGDANVRPETSIFILNVMRPGSDNFVGSDFYGESISALNDYSYVDLFTNHGDATGAVGVSGLDLNGWQILHSDGGNFNAIPSLRAVQTTPYEGQPGLILAHDPTAFDGTKSAEFMLGAGHWDHVGLFGQRGVLVDAVAWDDVSFPFAEIDVAGSSGANSRGNAYMFADETSAVIQATYAPDSSHNETISARADASGPRFIFAEGDGSVAIPSLRATQSVPWDGEPGLVLASSPGDNTAAAAEFMLGHGDWQAQSGYYAIADLTVRDHQALIDFLWQDGPESAEALFTATSEARMAMVYANTGVLNRLVAAASPSGPHFDFHEGDGTVSIPSLYAMQSVPYESLPGLTLAAPSAAVENASEFLVAAGDYALPHTNAWAVVDIAASTDSGFGLGFEQDFYADDGLGNTVALYLFGYTSSGVAFISSPSGLTIGHSSGTPVSVFGAPPVAQHAAIPDVGPSDSLDDLRTSHNALLAAMRTYGWIAA